MGELTKEIRELGAEVVGLAVTPTFAQMAFARSLAVEFPLLSDWEGSAARAYGVRYEIWKGHRGLAKRSLFVVGKDGIVRYRWVTDDALELPDLSAAMDVLRRL